MMPLLYYALVAALLVADAALSRWRPARPHVLRSALALGIAYVPMVALPALSPLAVTVIAAVAGLLGLVSYARLVGLGDHPRFLVSALACSLAFFVAARLGLHRLVHAMPVFTIFVVAGAGAVRAEARGFLQKTCLAWLGLLVYGYLFAHAALFSGTGLRTEPPSPTWIALVLVLAKAADVLWEAAQRLGVRAADAQVAVCLAGGAVGGALVALAVPGALSLPELVGLGAVVGLGSGAGSRVYKLIVTDVLGEDPRRPMKGTMLFGFAFALALSFHYVRLRGR